MRPLILLAFSLTAACSSPFGAYDETDPDAALDDAALDDDAATKSDASPADTSTPPPTDTGTGGTDTGAPPPPPTDSGAPPPPADTGPPSAGGCSLKLAGATGKEADGMIPVCCQPGSADKAAIMEVFKMVNDHRAANGKAALVYDEKLEAPIQGHCEHMRTHTFFSHNAPEAAVSSFTGRASKCGASAGGENIAWGYPTAAAVMDGWKKSSGHNANMLSGSWKRMAVGKSGTYWGQLFGP